MRVSLGVAWRVLPTLLLIGLVAVATAQRVQLPAGGPIDAPAWGTPSAAPAPTFAPPPVAFDPYGTPAVTGAPITGYGAPLGTPPPATGLPYSYSPPAATAAPAWGAPVAPSYSYNAPPPSAGLYNDSAPLGWQPGTYGFQQGDGTTVRFRRFVARLRAEHTLLLGDNTGDALEINRTEIASTFALPIGGQIESPLLVTPGFAFNWFAGPDSPPNVAPRGPDLPPRTYDAYLDLAWYPRLSPEFGAELGFRTGVWTDFEEYTSDTMRFLGRGVGVVSLTPQFEVLLGAVFLDRIRVKTLPAGGVRWRPSPDWDLYLVFPNPKVRRSWFSSPSADWWWYVAGEYGGGSWTAERADLGDRFDYNDLRLLFGLEWQTPTQARGHAEIGYVFDREVIFDSATPRFKADDAVLFRVGIGF